MAKSVVDFVLDFVISIKFYLTIMERGFDCLTLRIKINININARVARFAVNLDQGLISDYNDESRSRTGCLVILESAISLAPPTIAIYK